MARRSGADRGDKGVTDKGTLRRYYHTWDHAADRTPHGKPIVFKPEDFEKAQSPLTTR